MHGIYEVVDTSCGKIFIAEIETDLCAVSFNPAVCEAVKTLQLSYPSVRFDEGHVSNAENVAKLLGRPTACRAVARACRDNVLAVVIPCHRVIASDGSLGGYRYGIEIKKKLLEMERSKK